MALNQLGEDGNGQVAAINVGVDPDTTDPRLGLIDLGHPDLPGGAAIDPASHEVLVSSGQEGNGGFLDLIDETSLAIVSGSPFAFPPGSDSGVTPTGAPGQVLFDSVKGAAIVSTGDASTCPTAGACTGFAGFNLATQTFGPVIQSYLADSFALNATTQTIIAPADAIDPGLGTGQGMDAIDLPNSTGCIISDESVSALAADPDSAGFDPTTNIVVVGNYDSSQATVINLNGAAFDETVTPCMLNEGGTLPNSVNIDTGTDADMPGVAVNPVTHQAFLTDVDGPAIALVGLPSSPVTQLGSGMVTAVAQSTIPNDPNGNPFVIQAFPYATVVDAANNLGYVLSASFDFIVQIDLSVLQSNPAAITTPLPSGSCAGISTAFACDNGNGVKFFPTGFVPESENTITVTNTTDPASTSGNGFCTLREAINNANAESDTSGGDCAAGTGTDYIKFSVSGTITLVGSGLPAIQNTLTIDGTGQTITVSGANLYIVLAVNGGATLNLNNLTIANGSAPYAGGVSNSGILTVTNSTFSGNSTSGGAGGGGIYSIGGMLTVTNSTFSGNSTSGDGGGILSYGGTLTVTNSTFSGNSAVYGGGIFNEITTTASVTNSTFSGNSAASNGGGGGILNESALTVTNSTFSGNSGGTGGGIYNEYTATASVTNSTFSGNSASLSGGGIYNGGSATLSNSILAGSTDGNCAGTGTPAVTDGGYNISDDGTCKFTGTNVTTSKPIGDSVSDSNVALDPLGLQNNGGPTQTIALESGSYAIAAIPAADCPATDQRGAPRPAPGYSACDVGAFEYGGIAPALAPYDRRKPGQRGSTRIR